jgi:hypothetical protein
MGQSLRKGRSYKDYMFVKMSNATKGIKKNTQHDEAMIYLVWAISERGAKQVLTHRIGKHRSKYFELSK